jgi:hypothetical protein
MLAVAIAVAVAVVVVGYEKWVAVVVAVAAGYNVEPYRVFCIRFR